MINIHPQIMIVAMITCVYIIIQNNGLQPAESAFIVVPFML